MGTVWFLYFENCFLLSKTRKTKRTRLIHTFFYCLEKHKTLNKKNKNTKIVFFVFSIKIRNQTGLGLHGFFHFGEYTICKIHELSVCLVLSGVIFCHLS